ncbi:MAG: hypothetical protein RLY17_2117 [Pseudomonadota bacterium]|jgi:hypothetical protein
MNVTLHRLSHSMTAISEHGCFHLKRLSGKRNKGEKYHYDATHQGRKKKLMHLAYVPR